MSDSFDALLAFMGLGGTVLWLIGLLVFAMWSLILERLIFLGIGCRSVRQQRVAEWSAREDNSSWYARRIREAMLSRAGQAIDRNMTLIKTLILLCPLFGLVGTVTGMIEVFTVLSIAGSGDVKPIAAGISRATIPTMAGMVAALSGVFAMTWLSRRAVREKALIQDQLDIGTG